MRVAGKILINSDAGTFHNATLHIYAEDVGLLDESAIILATQRIHHVSHKQGKITTLPFAVDFTAKDLHSDTIIRAHISMSGSPEIKRDDLVTTQAFSVNLLFPHDNMMLHLKKVT